MNRIVTLFFSLALVYQSSAQNPQINEVMAANSQTLYDEDNDTPDWIELYNPTDSKINLEGYILSDTSNDWTIPAISIASHSHLLIFASGKDRNTPPLVWNTIIDKGDEWKYTIPTSATSSQWHSSSFDDSDWSSGASGFGYGDGDDATVTNSAISIFIRKNFTVEDISSIEQIVLHMDYDDAFVAYINGTEVARANITSSGQPAFDQPADNADHEALMYRGYEPEAFYIDNFQQLLQPEGNTLAIEIHNHSTTSSDLTGIPFLSIATSSGVDQLSEFLSSSQNFLHTNFKLDSKGELLLLLAPDGALIDSITVKTPKSDISLGRSPDGSNEWKYFAEPTPGSANNTPGFLHQSGEVIFSKAGGIYSGSQQVSLSSANANDAIYYTTNGDLPTINSTKYAGTPLQLSTTTIIRAQVINGDALPGDISTQTYLINRSHQLLVISLVTAPANLWDEQTGMYVRGPNAEANPPYFGSNFWEDWEKPVHITLFEQDGSSGLGLDAGMKIFGGWSRANEQRSLAIYARKTYGATAFEYKIFNNLEIDKFSSIVLRNSGNDWNLSMFRDAFMTSLFHESVDKQAYRPSVIYLNGEYWGIQNIREKVNEDFLASHHDVSAKDVIILELDGQPIAGDETSYRELISFVTNNNLATAENYEYVATQMDIQNFIEYMAGNIYVDNKDWPGNNIKFWKSAKEGGKWRWITYDTDFGYSIWGESPTYNTLEFALNAFGNDWPNPAWSTLLLRKLLTNNAFKQQFINTFADRLNTNWLPDRAITKIDEMAAGIRPEIEQHLTRWGGNLDSWNQEISKMKNYAQNRPANVRNHLITTLSAGAQKKLTIKSNNTQGYVQLNTIRITDNNWSGIYFQSVPVQIEALPLPGYRFVRWEGDITRTERVISLTLTSNTSISAVYEESDDDLSAIVINEINYNPSKEWDTEDWIELYNKSGNMINLSGWKISDTDESHAYIIPDGTILDAGQYLVVCRDQEIFSSFYPFISTVGNMDFGLSSDGDCVRLYDLTGSLADEVCYEKESTWPDASNGFTLALKDPYLNNSLPDSWYSRSDNGTPGAENLLNPIVSGLTPDSAELTIYPNPYTGGTLSISLADPIPTGELSLISLDGKIWLQQHVTVQTAKIEIELPPFIPEGLYILKIQSADQSYFSKLLIAKP